MKKISILAASCCMLLTSCGVGGTSSTSGWGDVLGAVLNNAGTITDVITSVIGYDKVSQSQLIGTWKYQQPGVAFTSENLLAKAGGEVAASQIKQKLQPYYQQVGISASNTQMVFNQDGTFTAVIAGRKWGGNYTLNESTGALQMQGVLLNLNGYAKRTSNGISILFESKKILSLIQTMATMSGNTSLQQIGEITKSYDGVRVGFDMSR